MTWLRGTTTWGNCVDDLTKLACGEMADATATVCDSADAWVREIAGQNLIRTKAGTEVNTGPENMRAGYFSLCSYQATNNPNTLTWLRTICRQTAVFSGVPTGLTANQRWVVFITVFQPNSVAGNYSTASLRGGVIDLDNNTVITQGIGATPNASGDWTMTLATKTVSGNISDPSGFLKLNTVFMRSYTGTYLGGVDWFGPMWCRRVGGATFTTAPPGTAGTDRDVNVDIPVAGGGAVSLSNMMGPSNFGLSAPVFPGGSLGGVGIKTNAGLTGAQYTFSFDMAYMKMRLWPQAAAYNGCIALDWGGGGGMDGGTYRKQGGYTEQASGSGTPAYGAWLRPFQTPGSVDPSSQIQYWLSVKPKKLIVILNGDPGYSGVLTYGGFYKFTSFDWASAGYDKFDAAMSQPATNISGYYTSPGNVGHMLQFRWLDQRWCQDGQEGRDWQTGWCRCDGQTNVGSTDQIVVARNRFSVAGGPVMPIPGIEDSPSVYGSKVVPFLSSKPNVVSGRWRLYGFTVADRVFGTGPQEDDFPRGYMPAQVTSPLLYVPGGLWGSGDELVDTATGTTFFLVYGGWAGLLAFFSNSYQSTTPIGAGVAIREE